MLNSDRLIALRKKHNYTQAYMASKLGIDRTSYVKYETSGIQPQNDVMSKICEIFDVSTDYLLGLSDIPKHTPQSSGQKTVSNEDLKFALFGDVTVDDDLLEDIKDMSRILAEKKKQRAAQNKT
ncbi:hypothetical protein FACS1894105_09280 [Clostridia bacterium]|nr:hypothetical protein FACS1894105_09280 [Clostridia bacterium]